MATSFKDSFIATQTRLRDKPTTALHSFSATTRQSDGLSSEARIREFRLVIDEPPALGGADRGPDPVELLLAALGASQEATYRLYADTLGIPIRSVSVRLEGRIDLRGLFAVSDSVRPGFKDIRATVTIDSPASAEDIERLKVTVDRHSPVLDSLRNVTPVQTSLDLVNSAVKPAAA